MKKYMIPLITIFIFCSHLPAFAAFESEYVSARLMGMGKAYVAVCDDANSALSNPAGLDCLYGMSLSSGYTKYFGMDELTKAQIIYSIATNFGGLSVDISDFGDALYSVLNNIIQNAVEHGKASRINIKIQEKQENFEIRIEDNGVGIPDEIKKSIFEEGFKFGEKGHTGLGLFIVKNAVKNYEGNIRVEDNIPNGTVFILELKKSGGIG